MRERLVQQRCWNHESRGAVCRCPNCNRPFCRECVSEHDSRLLCAACIKASVTPVAARKRTNPFMFPILALLSTIVAWAIFFTLGQIAMETITLAERSRWHGQ